MYNDRGMASLVSKVFYLLVALLLLTIILSSNNNNFVNIHSVDISKHFFKNVPLPTRTESRKIIETTIQPLSAQTVKR